MLKIRIAINLRFDLGGLSIPPSVSFILIKLVELVIQASLPLLID
jgi:hypothetical protein